MSEDFSSLTAKGNAALQAGNFDEAVNCFKEAIEIQPEDAPALANLGLAYEMTGNHEEALAACQRATEINPDYDVAWTNLGKVNFSLKRNEDGMAAFKKALELNEDSAMHWSNLGTGYVMTQDPESAVDAFKKAIELDRKNIDALFNLGVTYQSIKQFSNAKEMFERVLQINPKDAESKTRLKAVSALASKEKLSQVKDLKPAGKGKVLVEKAKLPGGTGAAPPSKEYAALSLKATTAFNAGKGEEAVAAFRKLTDMNPDNADDWVKLGLAYELDNNPEQAKAALERALSIDPSNENALLNMARNQLIAEDYDAAIETNKQVLEKNPKNAIAWMNIGTAQAQKDDANAAIEAYRKAVQIDPKLAHAWFNLGKTYEKVQEYDNAAKGYEQALRLNPKDQEARQSLQKVRSAAKTGKKGQKPAPVGPAAPAAAGAAGVKGAPKLKSSAPLGPRFYDSKETTEKMRGAIAGAFFAIALFYIVTFLISCIQTNIYGQMIDPYSTYSNGSSFNEVLALWAVAFTPITQLNLIQPNWPNDWLIYLAPCLAGGLILAWAGRGIKYTIIATAFFVFWGFVLPVIYVLLVPLFFNVSPPSFNAALATGFQTTLFSDSFTNFFTSWSNLYLGWCFAGAIQLAAFSFLFALPFALIVDLFKRVTQKK